MKCRIAKKFLSFALGGITLILMLTLLMSLLHEITRDKPVGFPDPRDIYASFPGLSTLRVDEGVMAQTALWTSFERIAIIFLVSAILGLITALVLALNRRVWDILQPAFDFFRSIPVTFLVPAGAILAGHSAAYLPIWLSSIPCTLLVVFHMRTALSRISSERLMVFALLAGTRNRFAAFRHLILPSLMLDWLAGFRLSVSYAIVVLSVLEYMSVGSSEPGFGYVISQVGSNESNNPSVYAAVICFGLLGFIINKALELLEPANASERRTA